LVNQFIQHRIDQLLEDKGDAEGIEQALNIDSIIKLTEWFEQLVKRLCEGLPGAP